MKTRSLSPTMEGGTPLLSELIDSPATELMSGRQATLSTQVTRKGLSLSVSSRGPCPGPESWPAHVCCPRLLSTFAAHVCFDRLWLSEKVAQELLAQIAIPDTRPEMPGDVRRGQGATRRRDHWPELGSPAGELGGLGQAPLAVGGITKIAACA